MFSQYLSIDQQSSPAMHESLLVVGSYESLLFWLGSLTNRLMIAANCRFDAAMAGKRLRQASASFNSRITIDRLPWPPHLRRVLCFMWLTRNNADVVRLHAESYHGDFVFKNNST